MILVHTSANQGFDQQSHVKFQPLAIPKLVGGFNPSEKYARQIGSFPQVGVKIKDI